MIESDSLAAMVIALYASSHLFSLVLLVMIIKGWYTTDQKREGCARAALGLAVVFAGYLVVYVAADIMIN